MSRKANNSAVLPSESEGVRSPRRRTHTKIKATIAILNYEREETLRRALERAVRQSYAELEILVVDNASTDGSVAMVREEFPGVRVVRLDENVGCAARNRGVEAATGEIVVTLDNDVLLEGEDAVSRIVAAFEKRPDAACLNFKILDATGDLSKRDWCHPRAWQTSADESFLTDYVLEGASAFRRKAFLSAGGYWPLLFIGHEGWDLALRLIDGGWDLLYWPSVAVTHLASPDARPQSRIYYTFTRNAVWVAARNHRLGPALRSLAKDMALMGFSSLRAGHLGNYLRGLTDAARGFGEASSVRAPLRRETYRKLRSVREHQPSVFHKAMRHFRERPI